MSAATGNTAIVPGLVGSPALPFQIYETRPDSITQHVIWDYELDKLVNISRPITLGAATSLLGAFVGLLPVVIETIRIVAHGKPLGLGHLALTIIAAICGASGGVASYFAYQGQMDAFRIREEVRSRNLRAINSGQAGAI